MTACKIQVGVLYAEWQRTKKSLDTTENIRAESWSQTFVARSGLDEAVRAVLDNYIPARL